MRSDRGALLVFCSFAVAAGSVACFFDPSVPATAAVGCRSTDDCPPGYLCRDKVKLCFRTADLDEVPPALIGTPQLTPASGTIGTRFVIEFETSEPLYELPRVVLVLGDRTPAWSLISPVAPADATAFAYGYDVNGSEQVSTSAVAIDLVDRAGNSASGLLAGNVVIDFASPRLVEVELTPAVIARTGSAALTLSYDEPLAAAPLVVARDSATGSVVLPFQLASSVPPTYRLTWTPTADALAGNYLIDATASDPAGNTRTESAVAQLTLDDAAPTVSATTVHPTVTLPGDLVRVAVTFSEPLAQWPTLDALVSGHALHFETGAHEGAQIAFSHQVQVGADGNYALQLGGFADAAGNAAPAQSIGNLVVDGTPPALVDYWQSASSLLASDRLTVQFSVDELLAEVPLVKFGEIAATREGSATAPYSYFLDLAGTGLEGTFFVDVALVDLAGNRVVRTPGLASVDALAPELVDIFFSPPAAALGVTALCSVTASEPLAAPPVLTFAAPGNPGFVHDATVGLSHIYQLAIDASVASGHYELVRVGLVDLAGNRSDVDVAMRLGRPVPFDVDSVAPTVASFTLNHTRFSQVAGFDQVVATLVLSEPAGTSAPLSAELAGQPMVCQPIAQSPPTFRCAHDVAASDGEGSHPLNISFRDAAGNVGFGSRSVEFDFTAPALVASSARIELVPAASNPLRSVATATVGTRAAVSFGLTEAVVSAPVVHATAPATLAFTQTQQVGNFYSYEYTVTSSSIAQGHYALAIDVSDDAGNAAILSLDGARGDLVIDTVAPVIPPDTVTPTLRHMRAPWNTFALVECLDCSLEAGATALVVDNASDLARVVGSALVDSSGRFGNLTLSRPNIEDVWLTVIDAAGNAAVPRLLRERQLVYTLYGKVVGQSSPNPNRLEALRWLTPALRQPLNSTTGATELGSSLAQASGGPVSWQRGYPSSNPGQRYGAAAAYDVSRDRVVVFGGAYPGSPSSCGWDSATWEWDGAAWRLMAASDPEYDGDPAPRARHAMGYDAARGVVVLHGGMHRIPGDVDNDFWEWNGRSWRRVRPVVAPGVFRWDEPHLDSAMVFDPARQAMLIATGDLTGWTAGLNFWDGTTISPTGVTVSYQIMGMASDPRSGQILAIDSNGALRSWADHFAQPTLFNFDPRTPTFDDNSLVFDTQREQWLIFSSWPFALWWLDGNLWRQLVNHQTPVVDPEALYESVVAFHAGSGETLVFGGDEYQAFECPNGLSTYPETWIWNGSTMRGMRSAGQWQPPSPMNASQDATTPGLIANSMAQWHAWDGATWSWLNTMNCSASMYPGAIARDPVRSRVVVAETYLCEWDGLAFTQLCTLGMPPCDVATPGRALLVFDPDQGVVLLLQNDRLLSWDGSTMQPLCGGPLAPGCRIMVPPTNGPFVFDSSHHLARLYPDPLQSMQFEWDGTQWSPVSMTVPGELTALADYGAAYDPGLGKTIFFGGQLGAGLAASDTWAHDGASWSRLEVVDLEGDGGPERRRDPVMTYNDATGRVMLVGGDGDGPYAGHVWSLDTGASARPALVMRFAVHAALPEQVSAIRGFDLMAMAGASGEQGGAPLDGAELLIWNPLLGWQSVATNDSSNPWMGLLEWSHDGADLAQYLFQDELHFAIAPRGRNGSGQARVDVMSYELRIRYRQ